MDNCIIFFSKTKRKLFDFQWYKLRWYALQSGGFYIIELNYTKEQFEKMNKRRKGILINKIYKLICRNIKYIYVPQSAELENHLMVKGCGTLDGGHIYCQLINKIIRKTEKNLGRILDTIAIYDVMFTNETLVILDEVSNIANHVTVYTGDVENAKDCCNFIYEQTGLPISIMSEYKRADILIALSKLQNESIENTIVLDIYNENTDIDKNRVSTLYFTFDDDLKELKTILGTRVNQRVVEFLAMSNFKLNIDKNIKLLSYK